MDFSYSSDQQMLHDSVQRYLQQQYQYSQRARTLEAHGFSAKTWQDFADFGWLGAVFPEEVGGFGGGGVEAAILMEQCGRHLVLEPYLWTVIVGGNLLLHGLTGELRSQLFEQLIGGQLQLALASHEGDAGQDLARVTTVARPSGSAYVLSGGKPVVPNGALADKFFVSARTSGGDAERRGVSLFLVDRYAPGVALANYRTNDGQTAAALTLHDVAVDAEALVGVAGEAVELMELALDHGSAAICAETVGSASYLLETTCTYLKTREQYGAPLARLQVLQHRMADMYVAVELARSMAQVAAVALGKEKRQRMRDISAAKVQAVRTARFVGREAVQLHGGMGMSEELDVSAHFKRLMLSALQFGDEAQHLARFSAISD
jgi:alkylation response protein AidB-like acyl-CoA dehydrogenase